MKFQITGNKSFFTQVNCHIPGRVAFIFNISLTSPGKDFEVIYHYYTGNSNSFYEIELTSLIRRKMNLMDQVMKIKLLPDQMEEKFLIQNPSILVENGCITLVFLSYEGFPSDVRGCINNL